MASDDAAAKRAAHQRLSSYFAPGGCPDGGAMLVAEEAIYQSGSAELRELLTGLGKAVQGGESVWELRRDAAGVLRERAGSKGHG